MHSFTLLFLGMLTLSIGIRLWLNWRQIYHVASHRGSVPEDFRDKVSLEEHQKAADYTITKSRFGRWPMLYDVLLLLLWTLGGGLEWLDQNLRTFGLDPIMTGVAVILSLMLISTVLELPFSIYSTFVIEQRFGFNRTTAKTFVTDIFKGAMLTLILGVPLIFVVLWLMEKAGNLWWLYAWLVWSGFSLFIAWVFPRWIAPIFNKFTPLEEGSTLTRIKNLLERCGFSSNGVFVIDGSRRSSHGNAYFSGFGRNKRIVFFDTLLKMLNDDQLEAVLAHELGHFKRKHVFKAMALSFVATLVGLWILAGIMQHDWFYQSLGVSTPSTYMALVLFSLVAPVFTFLLNPVMSLLSRKNEFEADALLPNKPKAVI